MKKQIKAIYDHCATSSEIKVDNISDIKTEIENAFHGQGYPAGKYVVKTPIKEPNFKNFHPQISQSILSKNGLVKQIRPLTDCTATRTDFLP